MNLTRRIKDAWIDPVRRRHSISRIAESYIPSLAVLLLVTHSVHLSLGAAALCTLLEFLLYELVLEPLGLTGYYWERGPRYNETFTRW